MRLKWFILAAALLLPSAASAQQEEGASAWAASSHSSVRLIAGGRAPDGAYRIGVEIRMSPGFKTYWRQPGDSGVPPVFDWSGSANLGSVSVRWPVPKRYVDQGLVTIGYKGRVIFPALIRPAEVGKPLTATLKLDYAVCDRICIPAHAEVSLRLPEAAETAFTTEIDQFRAFVPRGKEPGKLDDRLGLIAAALRNEGTRKAVQLDIATPPGSKLGEAFLEGPDGWLFGSPTILSAEADKMMLSVPIDDRPKNVGGLVPVVLTLTGAPEAIEIRFDLDMSPPKP